MTVTPSWKLVLGGWQYVGKYVHDPRPCLLKRRSAGGPFVFACGATEIYVLPTEIVDDEEAKAYIVKRLDAAFGTLRSRR